MIGRSETPVTVGTKGKNTQAAVSHKQPIPNSNNKVTMPLLFLYRHEFWPIIILS